MIWLAVDKNGNEFVYESKPIKGWTFWDRQFGGDNINKLPKGSIEKLIGRVLTWEDEPIGI